MATTITSLVTMVRYIINDISTTVRQVEKYDTSATRPTVFTLDEDNVISVTKVFKNGTEQDASLWSYDSDTGEVTVSFSCANNDVIEFLPSVYEKYSDDEIGNYIRHALYQLSMNNYFTFKVVSASVYPDLSDDEEQLVAMIAGVLINPDNKSYTLPNLTVKVAKSQPTYEIIKQIIARFKKCKSGVIDLG